MASKTVQTAPVITQRQKTQEQALFSEIMQQVTENTQIADLYLLLKDEFATCQISKIIDAVQESILRD